MARVIGIDLGTTNTAVAVLDGGRPRVLEDDRGYKVLPSVVSAKGEGRFVVGQAAHNLIITAPERTVYATKRLIGRRFDSPEVQRVLTRVQYKLRPAADGGVQMLVGDQWMTPTEVAAVILQVARGIAERALGDTVSDAVITVPAYFNHAQRKATLEAAQLAGLPCERLLNEPTAAALAYGLGRLHDHARILVFDFGGGTLDVTILEMFEGILDVLTSVGDDKLGGKDVDETIVQVLREAFKDAHGKRLPPPSKDKRIAQALKEEAENIKKTLSDQESMTVRLGALFEDLDLEMEFTRDLLDSHLEEHLMRAMATVNEALARTKLRWEDIDVLLPVGGSSRIPMFRRALEFAAGKPFLDGAVDPDQAVALGAAIAAGIENELYRQKQKEIMILDVSPHRLGVATIKQVGGEQYVDDYFSELIPKDAKLPAVQKRDYVTLSDGTKPIGIRIYEAVAESNLCRDHHMISELTLRALAPDARDEPIQVEFRYTLDGTLEVSAHYISAPMVQVDGRWVLDAPGGDSGDAWRKTPLADLASPLVEQAERLLLERGDEIPRVRDISESVKLAALRGDEEELRRRLDTLTDLLIEVA